MAMTALEGPPETPVAREQRLYSEETVYTFRIPLSLDLKQRGGEGLGADIGPTVRPVMVKKRAGLPAFGNESEVEWSMRGGVPGVRA
jgi:hypothetical protein